MSADTLSTPAGPYSATPAQHTAAKIIGIIYPIQMATGIFGEVFARGQLIVRGDAARTAENIMASEQLFRLSIAADLITYILVMVLTWAFYVLLRPVNRHLALLGAFFRLSELAVLCIATVNSLVILRLLSGAAYLKTFDTNQLHSLVMLAYNTQGLGMSVGFILLGLGSAVFAYLLLRSRYVPKAFALLGVFASLLLALGSLAIIVFPGLGAIGMSYMMPMGLYEVGLGFWLLIKGIKAPSVQPPNDCEFTMKTNLPSLIATTCLAALSLTGTVVAQTPAASPAPRIKAYFYRDYGSPDVLRLEEIEKPVPADDQVLVKVRAASVNPLDWHYMEGTPYIVRLMEFGLLAPKVPRLGVDMAGTVEAVGKNVTQFKPGDEVFGQRFGAFGEYVAVREDKALVLKPPGVTFEQAAALPVAAITALQGLRDKGKVQPGQKVLINGASGGVGTFAVQLAKAMGAEVTGVCSGRNVELVRSLGADHIIDYTKEDYTKNGQRYDVMLDNVANHSFFENTGVLNPQGKYVLIGGGGPEDQGFIGPLILPIKAALMRRFVTQEVGFMVAEVTKNDLSYLADLVQTGKMKVVIDKTYPLSQLPDAMRYLETGRARGKVIVTVGDTADAAPASPKPATSAGTSPILVALGLIGVPIAALILPIIAALVLNRRFRERNPEKKNYRWGYYFSIMAFIGGLILARFLNTGLTVMILCGVIYAILAWFFAQRQRWAWVALTILSFNPIAWIINAIYLWRRWGENSVATPVI